MSTAEAAGASVSIEKVVNIVSFSYYVHFYEITLNIAYKQKIWLKQLLWFQNI